jgi:hypothetical protein
MDGAPQAITLIGGSGSSASDSAETLYIGRYGKSSGGGSGFFSGYIAALYLWKNRILSPREALLLSSDPLAPFRLRDIHSGIYVNIIVGSTCWGHVTGVTQTNVRTFASHWTGSGIITGTGDSEELDLYIGQSMVSEVVNTGAVTVTLTQNSYQAGDTMTLEYRTGATQAACEASGWTAYTVPFASSGYVQCRVSK